MATRPCDYVHFGRLQNILTELALEGDVTSDSPAEGAKELLVDAGTEFMEALKIFRGTEYQIDIAEAQKNLGVRAIETGGVLLHCLVTVPLTWMVRPLVGSGQWSFANGLPGRLPVL